MRRMQVVILADGDVGSRSALDASWPGWLEADARVVAADGGARHAHDLGLVLDRWVGDGDSLGDAGLQALIEQGIPAERSPTDKDESDTELALMSAVRLGATRITVLGALGGPRLDHALANLGLLALPSVADIETELLAPDSRVRLLQAPGSAAGSRADGPVRLGLATPTGSLVSLLPLGADAVGVTTTGLAFPLADEPLLLGRTRGLSNVVVGADPSVALRAGRLLVVETPARL